MFKIQNMIEERKHYALGVKTNRWRDELLARVIEKDDDDEILFLTVGSTLFEKRKLEALQKKYHIVGAYKLGPVFANLNIPFYIVHLSKTPSEELRVALYEGKCRDSKRTFAKDGSFAVPEKYNEIWVKYKNLLEAWINGGSIPESNDKYEFTSLPVADLYKGSFVPETYSRENIELRELLDKQDTKPLSGVASIMMPMPNRKAGVRGKILKIRDLKYPLNVNEIELGMPTDVVLQRGDIVIPKFKTSTQAYLFNTETEETVYASDTMVVVRCEQILPEYLYLYLCSDTAIKALNARYVGVTIQRISAKDLLDLPIATPTQDSQRYITDFNVLTNLGIRNYSTLQRSEVYKEHLSKIQNEEEKADNVEDILNIELADKIVAYREDQLRTFLNDDLKELNTCYKNGAYKATLILAGSILEAVLIDWLSEIHHTDYFQEEYYVTDRRTGRQRQANLVDYINEIKYIERPHWMDEAKKAHAIRKKRNLVHAKLCMASDEISEQSCKQVIEYLSDVLKTRGVR